MNTSATLGRFLLEEEGDKLVLREKDQARSLVYIFFGPLSLGFALLFCLGLREELKAPGDIGKFVLANKLAFLQFDPSGAVVRVVGLVISIIVLLSFAILAVGSFGIISLQFLRANKPRIVDRTRNILTRGRTPICHFNNNTCVLISKRSSEHVGDRFLVLLSPCDNPAGWVGVLERLPPYGSNEFTFEDEVLAHQFAHILGSYLSFRVVRSPMYDPWPEIIEIRGEGFVLKRKPRETWPKRPAEREAPVWAENGTLFDQPGDISAQDRMCRL